MTNNLPLAYRQVTELPVRKVARPKSTLAVAVEFALFIGALAVVCAVMWWVF